MISCRPDIEERWRAAHSWGGLRLQVITKGLGVCACVYRMCVCEAETAVVIAGEEPCAQRTLRLIKGGDRVIIHHGPLERLTLKSLLLINSETVLRINNNIKEGSGEEEAQTRPGSASRR